MPTGALLRVGTYSLIRPLAHGGMADIYLAQKDGEDRHVALKVLAEHRAEDKESVALFFEEGKLVRLLAHEHIAAVYEVATAEDGQNFIAMEHIHGQDLRDTLNMAMTVHHDITHGAAISIVCAAGRALDHAHRAVGPDGKSLELVHRDVSLSNIMVGHDGHVKLVDFGIASTALSAIQTEPGIVRGKASYMAPEQCLGDPIDRRTDVFALGIVLYEVTTGTRCFHGATDFDRMLAVVRGEWRRPSTLVENFPPDLEEVIATALAIDPSKRYTSAAAFCAALERVARANDWAMGPATIRCMMRAVFGESAEQIASLDNIEPTMPELAAIADIEIELDPFVAAIAGVREDSISVVIEMLPMPAPTTSSSMRRRRLARGTESDGLFNDSLAARQDEWSTSLDHGPPRRRSAKSIPLA